jgi:hypothetical protein
VVTFATILLGLVVGVHPVSVLAGEGVAAIEIRLDGEVVAVLRGEPWSVECDFGARLAPHQLVAIAYDGSGRELGRARQLVNVPRPAAEAALVVAREDGRRVARLSWEAVQGAIAPLAVRVYLDGEPVPVEDPERIELPAHDDEQLHLLRAELDFTDNVSAVAEVVYGGFYADEVSAELTALPVSLEGKRKLPAVAELDGWVRSGDEELRVVAAESGPSEVLLVRSAEAVRAMRRWWLEHGASRVAQMLDVRGEVRAGFVWPYAEPTRGRTREYSLLPLSPSYSLDRLSLVQLMKDEPQPDDAGDRQRLADAVAIAGMVATAKDRRRAVILLLDNEAEDHSQLRPAEVRDYLRQLHVPLFVWSLGEPAPALLEGWGSVADVSSLAGMVAAVREVDRALQAQRILWVDGVHLPSALELGEGAAGVTLVASEATSTTDLGVLPLQ